ncbi:hypothetical protein KTD31_01475 [Burkholderia multivorans]|uniref:hypothetical protein n=1 Tax=Burkholderia multivorans TaxID=87883 RepID=UPI001C2453EB|nr:hypothetical protein [Burkholderia multivorans]MBU9200072.1 hypothetical protein [Burkholderia multivorans]MDN8078807.1 hypothetical protein [Burkholderia multivorans]
MWQPESMKTLRRTKGSDGKALPGLWENDLVRMEWTSNEAWECQVPLREIGNSNFYEFRPLELGGRWHSIGAVRTRAAGCLLAERLRDGTHVYQGAYHDDAGKVPGMVLPWTDVADEIASHPSVRPGQP